MASSLARVHDHVSATRWRPLATFACPCSQSRRKSITPQPTPISFTANGRQGLVNVSVSLPTWKVICAGTALIWLVGVRGNMRPEGMRLWGVWRAMDDTCLDAWTSHSILDMKVLQCQVAEIQARPRGTVQAVQPAYKTKPPPGSAKAFSLEMQGSVQCLACLPASQERRRSLVTQQQCPGARGPGCVRPIWRPHSLVPGAFWAALDRPECPPCPVCPHLAGGMTATTLSTQTPEDVLSVVKRKEQIPLDNQISRFLPARSVVNPPQRQPGSSA